MKYKPLIPVLSFLFLVLFSACLKEKLRYTCGDECEDLTIKVSLADSSYLIDKSYLADASYSIDYYHYRGSFNGATIYSIKKGKFIKDGTFTAVIKVNRSKLEDPMDRIVIHILLGEEIGDCWSSAGRNDIEYFPQNGIWEKTIQVKKTILRPVKVIRTNNDFFYNGTISTYSTCAGGYNIQIDGDASLNEVKELEARFAINTEACFTTTKITDSFYYDVVEEKVFIDENFSGITIEY